MELELFSSFSWFRTRQLSSNPTAFTDMNRYQTGTCKTPVICRLARLEKRLDFGCATRNTTPQAPCTELHGRYRKPKELARNAKNPGKTRVLQRTGQEPNNPRNPWENRSFKTRRRKIRRAPQNMLCAGIARVSAAAKQTF